MALSHLAERGEELRAICNLDKVMIALAPGARWNPDWGELLVPERFEGRTTVGPSAIETR